MEQRNFDCEPYTMKGKKLEKDVQTHLIEKFRNTSFYVSPKEHNLPYKGHSRIWNVDNSVKRKQDNQTVAILECKGLGEPKSWAYNSQMQAAYVELSDLSNNPELESIKLYLVVNRYPEKKDDQTSINNYVKLFEGINVKMYYRTDLESDGWKNFLNDIV